jgi:hypothetical protein
MRVVQQRGQSKLRAPLPLRGGFGSSDPCRVDVCRRVDNESDRPGVSTSFAEAASGVTAKESSNLRLILRGCPARGTSARSRIADVLDSQRSVGRVPCGGPSLRLVSCAAHSVSWRSDGGGPCQERARERAQGVSLAGSRPPGTREAEGVFRRPTLGLGLSDRASPTTIGGHVERHGRRGTSSMNDGAKPSPLPFPARGRGKDGGAPCRSRLREREARRGCAGG